MPLGRFLMIGAVLLAAPPAAKPSPAVVIAKVRMEWARDLHDKQLERIVRLYTPDAAFLQPDGHRVTGRNAIRELTKTVMAAFTSNITLTSTVVEYSGNLAYDSGAFDETLVRLADGDTIATTGNYLMVFKRQTDGSWLITQQVWTGSEPAHR